jgi:hypothetical protein
MAAQQDQSLILRVAHQWLRAKGDKVKVRRKDTGKVVWVSREKAKSSDYEPVKDEDAKPDGKKSVKPPKHPSGWRDGADEPELTADNATEWAESHTVTTPGGSQMFGTTHPDMSDEKDAGTSLVRDHIVPQALETARQAIKDGKKVVFIAEGSRQEDLDADEDYNEHHAVAKALNDEFGDKVQQDTWDDDPVNVFSEESPVWKELAEAAGDETGAHVGISVMLVGQGDDPDELRKAGILTPEAEAAIKKNMGIDMSKSLSDDDKEKLYRASFPADFEDEPNDISTLTDIYNGARQRNLMSKIEKAEAEGTVAISTAGGTHVWNLGPILSGKKASVSRIARNWLRQKVADLNPPLGHPGGTCHVVDRIIEEIRNPRLEQELVEEVQRGQELSNPEARQVYDPERERGAWKYKLLLTPHAQYRMDLRGISVPEIRAALDSFFRVMNDERSKGDTAKWDRFNRGLKVEWHDKRTNTFFVFTGGHNEVTVITTYKPGEPDPPGSRSCVV